MSTNDPRRWLLPGWAVFQIDVGRAARSWIVRAWVVLFALYVLVVVLDGVNPKDERVVEPSASQVVASVMAIQVVVWSGFIILVGAQGITADAGALADSVLSRGISRRQYYLAKLAARHAVTLVISLGLIGGVIGVASGKFTNDLSVGGTTFALLGIVTLIALLTSFALVLGSICRSSLVGVAVAWLVSYGGGLILSAARLEHYSPAAWLEALPDLLTGDYDGCVQGWLVGSLGATAAILWAGGAVHFSRKDV